MPEWPPADRALTLDSVILRMVPDFHGQGGFRPIFRIYGPDPLMPTDQTPKVLFSTPKRSNVVRFYSQVIALSFPWSCIVVVLKWTRCDVRCSIRIAKTTSLYH